MKSIKTLFEDMNFRSTLGESLILSVIFVTALYFISDKVHLKLDGYQDITLLFLVLITLFNGTLAGLISLFTITFGIYFFTFTYELKPILEYLVFVLLLGEFHFHFEKSKDQNREENHYLKAKFRELSNAFFALKISHDQLEKGYLLKPVTLRSLIIDLSDYSSQEDSYQKLFETFGEAFSLDGALFCTFDNKQKIQTSLPLGESKFEYDETHPLIAQSLLTKKPVFLAQSKIEMMEKEPILAVLPLLDSNDTILGIYIIEKMDFLEFSLDNILKIQILLEYLTQERIYHKNKNINANSLHLTNLDARFGFEVERLIAMYNHFDVNSAIVIVKSKSSPLSFVMDNFTAKKMRLLDMVTQVKVKDTNFYIFLLPLERVSGAVSFRDRIESELSQFADNQYEILISEIHKIKHIQNWIDKDAA
jgi:hypothetical protein